MRNNDEGKPRGSGGQPGNQNARKHGLYSKHFPTELRSNYQEALKIEGLDQEIAVLRVLIQQGVAEGASMEELSLGMSLLIRAIAAQHRMSPKAKDSLTNAIAEVLERVGAQMGLPIPTE